MNLQLNMNWNPGYPIEVKVRFAFSQLFSEAKHYCWEGPWEMSTFITFKKIYAKLEFLKKAQVFLYFLRKNYISVYEM